MAKENPKLSFDAKLVKYILSHIENGNLGYSQDGFFQSSNIYCLVKLIMGHIEIRGKTSLSLDIIYQ